MVKKKKYYILILMFYHSFSKCVFGCVCLRIEKRILGCFWAENAFSNTYSNVSKNVFIFPAKTPLKIPLRNGKNNGILRGFGKISVRNPVM